jgi:hypothetical protein
VFAAADKGQIPAAMICVRARPVQLTRAAVVAHTPEWQNLPTPAVRIATEIGSMGWTARHCTRFLRERNHVPPGPTRRCENLEAAMIA